MSFDEWFTKAWTDEDWLYDDFKNFDREEMKGAIEHAFNAGWKSGYDSGLREGEYGK